jgi:hypothetical protein
MSDPTAWLRPASGENMPADDGAHTQFVVIADFDEDGEQPSQGLARTHWHDVTSLRLLPLYVWL